MVGDFDDLADLGFAILPNCHGVAQAGGLGSLAKWQNGRRQATLSPVPREPPAGIAASRRLVRYSTATSGCGGVDESRPPYRQVEEVPQRHHDLDPSPSSSRAAPPGVTRIIQPRPQAPS